MLSARTIRNAEAVIVLVAALAASIFVPSRWLVPITAFVLVVSVAGVFVVRAWMQRPATPGSAIRREWLLEVGVMLAMAGLAAFIVLLVEFTE